MRSASWLHFYLETMRARRTLRGGDKIHNVAFAYNGRAFAGMQWRAAR